MENENKHAHRKGAEKKNKNHRALLGEEKKNSQGFNNARHGHKGNIFPFIDQKSKNHIPPRQIGQPLLKSLIERYEMALAIRDLPGEYVVGKIGNGFFGF